MITFINIEVFHPTPAEQILKKVLLDSTPLGTQTICYNIYAVISLTFHLIQNYIHKQTCII